MRVITVVGALAVSLLVVEGLLRLIGVSHPVFERADPVLGVSLIPHAEGRQTREGHSFVRINSFGFRDRERQVANPPGTFRIAVLGDSFTEARQVALEDAFYSVLERELNRHAELAADSIEVLNFGVSGYGTSQQLLTLQHRVWDFDPDAVLLAFYTGNDISDNSLALKGSSTIPYHYYEGDELLVDRGFVESDAFRFQSGHVMKFARLALGHSRLLQLLNHVRLVRKLERADDRNASTFAGPSEPGMQREVYVPPEDEVWKEAWRVTEGLLAAMHDEVSERDIRFFVVTLSSGIQVHPDPKVRSAFLRDHGLNDLFYPDRRVQSLETREGFPVLVLAPTLQVSAESSGMFLHGFDPHVGFGHWNESGHRRAGEYMARWLAPQITPSKLRVTQNTTAPGSPSLY